MKHIDITSYKTENKNNGIAREWALCKYFGIERTKHDNGRYDTSSDIETETLNISVKATGATLMSGSLCKGCKTFEGIWRRYRKNVHSNTFAYITDDMQAYLMDINEFSKFVHKFGRLERESKKNGGYLKIKLAKESGKMRDWLAQAI